MPYKYHAFISYSSKDVEWAAKLEAELKLRGIQAYRDQSRLTAGDRWDDQLQAGIQDSQHLIVLWSKQASESDWVEQERIYFQADDLKSSKNPSEKRRLVAVNLDAVNKALARYEQINDIKNADLYSRGAASLASNGAVWNKVLDKIEDSVKENDSIPIYKILMVSALASLQNLDLHSKAGLAPPFGETLSELEIKKDGTEAYKTELGRYYGQARSDWKPFGQTQTIDTILDELRDNVHADQRAPRIRWRDVGEEFWSDDVDKFEAALKNISQHLALIVIDPISLYDPAVSSRLSDMRNYLNPESCATAVLAPFSIPSKISHIRKILRGAANPIFRQYANPSFNGSTLYPLSVCAQDPLEVSRVLCSSLDLKLRQITQQQSTPFTSHGSVR